SDVCSSDLYVPFVVVPASAVAGGETGSAFAFAATTQPFQRLGEDGLTVGVAPTFLHVRQMRLVRLRARGCGRILPVPPRGQTAARAVPLFRSLRVHRERRT